MRVMTPKQEEIYQKLLKLADGDSVIVEEALRECARISPEPKLEDVVAKIRELTAKRRNERLGDLRRKEGAAV